MKFWHQTPQHQPTQNIQKMPHNNNNNKRHRELALCHDHPTEHSQQQKRQKTLDAENETTTVSSSPDENQIGINQLLDRLGFGIDETAIVTDKFALDNWRDFQELYDRIRTKINQSHADEMSTISEPLFLAGGQFCLNCCHHVSDVRYRRCQNENCTWNGIGSKTACHQCKRILSASALERHLPICAKLNRVWKKYGTTTDQSNFYFAWKIYLNEAYGNMDRFKSIVKSRYHAPTVKHVELVGVQNGPCNETRSTTSAPPSSKVVDISTMETPPPFPKSFPRDNNRSEYHLLYDWIKAHKSQLFEGKGFFCTVCLQPTNNATKCTTQGCSGAIRKFCHECKCAWYPQKQHFGRHNCKKIEE